MSQDTTPRLELLPAVDVQDGQAVRLVQGEAGSETGYGDPVEAALLWQETGAQWLHLVDLDAAFGRGDNIDVLRRVADQIEMKIEIYTIAKLIIFWKSAMKILSLMLMFLQN